MIFKNNQKKRLYNFEAIKVVCVFHLYVHIYGPLIACCVGFGVFFENCLCKYGVVRRVLWTIYIYIYANREQRCQWGYAPSIHKAKIIQKNRFMYIRICGGCPFFKQFFFYRILYVFCPEVYRVVVQFSTFTVRTIFRLRAIKQLLINAAML